MNLRIIAALVLATSLLNACATSAYRSPSAKIQPVSQLAVLEYNGTFGGGGVNIVKVDGKHRGIGLIRRYELAPGERSLKILLNIYATISEPIVLTFTAEAGQIYELKYEIKPHGDKDGTWRVWIENKQTGQSVANRQN